MSTLLRLIGRRLVALPAMVLGVTLLVFVVMSFSPSDPARLALGEAASAQALEQYRIAHHLNFKTSIKNSAEPQAGSSIFISCKSSKFKVRNVFSTIDLAKYEGVAVDRKSVV